MKRILSYFLLLALLLSLCGCTMETTQTTLPQVTQSETTAPAEITQPTEIPQAAEKVVIPSLIGRNISELPETDKYLVVESGQEHSEYPYGTIIRQEPEGGAWEDKGTTVYVITSLDQPEGSEKVPETEPIYWDPSDRENEQDREEQPGQDPQPTQPPATQPPTEPPSGSLDPNGSYTSKEDVALFIYTYGRLPNNFITKNQAENQYGKTSGLNKYGKCIGGDRFYNREGKLPSGYTYYECDIDTLYSSKRGAKRLVFTYSGQIYYTSDHYETFIRLY